MNRASSNRARYRRPDVRRRFRPRWIVAGALIAAVGLALDYPVVSVDKLEGLALAVLAVGPLVIALTTKATAERARVVAAGVGIGVVLVAYCGLFYNARFAPHDGYSVSITSSASIAEVQLEIRAISGSHALAADTSFSNGRIKVTFPGGDPATIAATISQLRRAPGIASVDACHGILC